MNLLSEFESHLEKSQLVIPREKILVAFSGGPDSAVLLDLFCKLQKKWKLKIAAAHLNHGLRGKSSEADALFVKKIAKKYGIPIFSGKIKIPLVAKKEKYSMEEAARLKRYHFLQKTAEKNKFKKIATAHTLNDQAETVWMRVLQGTGLRGLCGIRDSMMLDRTRVIRPLLPFDKKEILEYLKQEKILFRQDASNQSEKILRNKIRLKLIPFLEKNFHPQVLKTAARIPEIVSRESQALEVLEETFWKRVFKKNQRGKLHLDRSSFLALPNALQFRVLNRALKILDPKSGLGFEAWEEIRKKTSPKGLRWSLPRDIDFDLTPSQLTLYKK